MTPEGWDLGKDRPERERPPTGSAASPDAVLSSSSSFAEELAAAFRRHRPQGSARWNFSVAFTRLEERFRPRPPPSGRGPGAGVGVTDDAGGDGGTAGNGTAAAGGDGGARSLLHRLADRYVTGRLQPWIAEQAEVSADRATKEALATELQGVADGFDDLIEALRFLSARVERLEDAGRRRRSPVAAVGALAASPPGGWAGPVAAWLGSARPEGPVLHGECGDGELVEALVASGIEAKGAEPRGDVAWRAADRGVPVVVGEVPDLLALQPAGSLGGLVLSGVVDRLPVEELAALVGTAAERLAAGAPLVVVGTSPEDAAGWDPVARDLLPGRPLRPETWEVLLARAGFVEVGRLEPGPGHDEPRAYVVTARHPS